MKGHMLSKPGYYNSFEFRLRNGKENYTAHPRIFTSAYFTTLVPVILIALFLNTSALIAAPSSFGLLDARERQVVTTGTAKGNVLPTYDEVVGKDVLEFDYSLTGGSSAGVATNSFPPELSSEFVNSIKIGVRVSDSEQLDQISAAIELKGSAGIQNIPLQLKRGWNSFQETVHWDTIGTLSGVSFVVSPSESVTTTSGTLQFLAEFVKQTVPVKANGAAAAAPTFSLLDARERGVFNIGPAKGNVVPAFDESAGKDVWKFDYSVPVTSIIGVWSKSFPPELNSLVVDAIRIAVHVPNAEQANQVSVKAEVKGVNGMQSIPLRLDPGWNIFREPIHWNTIGNLSEVVFVVSPMAANPIWFNRTEAGPKEEPAPLTGTLYLDYDFSKQTVLQKNFTFIKVVIIFIAGLIAALLATLLGKVFGSSKDPSAAKDETVPRPLKWSLNRDLFYGMMTVFIAGIALVIYSLGTKGTLDAGFNFTFLAVAFAGAAMAELFKHTLTGRHLSAAEVFGNIFVAGLLASASSRQEILASPADWIQVFMFSNLIAALVFVIYQVSNARSLASSGKHLNVIASSLIVGTPYLFNWLLLVENANFLQTVIGDLTGGIFTPWPTVLETIGRSVVVFGFNEAVTNGISLAIKGRVLKTAKAHQTIFLVSVGVVAAPLTADLGSGARIASLPALIQCAVAVLTTMLSYAGLWGEVYLITGVSLDGGHHTAPFSKSISNHVITGAKKGMAYSGILLAFMFALSMLLNASVFQKIMASLPIVTGILSGALVFPLLKTIIETFDGSLPFFERTRYGYRNRTLYARGAVAGFGFAYMITHGIIQQKISDRIMFGLIIGLLASGGVSLLRDVVYAVRKQGRVQSWRLYIVDSFLGVFIGTALAFYLDARQVPVIVEKFKLYTSSGFNAVDYITYPLLNKWGRIDLGSYTGGAKLLFTESLAGVINWSIAAWLFAINKVFMQAFFEKQSAPIKFFFSKAGFAQLIEHMIYVLRWGLWMSPIIFTFLRMMPDPTWYNQDGAIRTLFAIYNNATMSGEAFRSWSLQIFVYVLAFDFFRILIWMDHMGLRVATLVNLSFIGMDKLDEKIARFIGPAAAQRYIPEAVKRFATWGPLLIPFYLPRGEAWDYAWNTSEAMQNAARRGGLLSALQSLRLPQMLILAAVSVLICAGISFCLRLLQRRARKRSIKSYELCNREYKVVMKENGEAYSEAIQKGNDISRRSYDLLDPCGRILFLMDMSERQKSEKLAWPVAGNFPLEKFQASRIQKRNDAIEVVNHSNGVKTSIHISLPDPDSAVEIWTIKIENLSEKLRQLKVVPYLEWVLNGGIHDRFHTQYQRLFPEMEYVGSANAILAWQKSTKSMGILAADIPAEGFLTSRMDFIGRAQSIWAPRALKTLNFQDARNTTPYPTFDPIGSMLIGIEVGAKSSQQLRLMIGHANNRSSALDMINKYLKPRPAKLAGLPEEKKKSPLIGHGEILPGTPQPYFDYADNGNKLLVHTPYTPRPFDHAMSNAIGHSVMVTNRGLHTSCNGNSQQNRLTPDCPDTVTKELPVEAIYLYDIDERKWYCPTYHPLNDPSAKNASEFSVDGTAVFHMTQGNLSTELTVFVPPEDPTGVYLLTLKNNADRQRKIRIAPYFQMALEFQPERSGTLDVRYDKSLGALFFENPRNMFRSGWAFASMSIAADRVETKRGRFFGSGRGVAHPYMAEKGEPDVTQWTDDRCIAGFVGTVEIPARGEYTVAVILGQADKREQAAQIVRKYKNIATVRKSLADTRKWWQLLMGTLEVTTNRPEFDRLQNWLKYQALVERIWARKGFYQTSGAFGFRDQLQDAVNLLWVDPALARKQILLHASHQFMEGDVFHWFFTLTDGRTAFSCRSHASDNPLWLVWGVVEYIKATGDDSILDGMISYVMSEFPFADLPKNKQGWGHLYHRASRSDSLYKHCLRSIDLIMEKRMGKHGLPLIRTGDWNDGLDEIGSEGKGESVWLAFFLHYIMKDMIGIIEKKEGISRKEYYAKKIKGLESAIERTWRDDRYLRAIHDDGTEIGVKGSGVWEIDALTAAWAVMSGINPERGLTAFNTALHILERDGLILLGWPALREDTKPYLGRSSKYPEGVRENGMYCHGVQWLIRAARILAEQFESQGDQAKASEYRQTAFKLWLKISPAARTTPEEIEIYGGQPNKQAADILTAFDPGRMIWNGYTGAAGWMLRQAFEGVVGASLENNKVFLPGDLDKPRGDLKISRVHRDVGKSPLKMTGSRAEEVSDFVGSSEPSLEESAILNRNSRQPL